MDAPIYIRFASIDSSELLPPISMHNQLFVIEASAAAGGGNENTILNLPDSPFIRGSSVAVAKSRLFIVGGDYRDHSERVYKFNGIHSVNLKDDSCWEASPLDEDRPAAFAYVGGTAVSDDGSLIYGLGLRGNIYAFDPETRTLQFHYTSAVPAPDTSLPRLLAFTDNKLYVNCASEDEANLLGYFDIKSRTWHNIGIRPRLFDLQTRGVVLVRDRYLISFGLWHPFNDEFCPALYVYDIQRGLWLPEPVQGLPNDGDILPSLGMPHHYRHPINILSVMQVRRDELKLALVWCISDNEQNEFHLSKFTLTIQEHGYFPHTFRAESLSSLCFSATGLLLDVNSVTA